MACTRGEILSRLSSSYIETNGDQWKWRHITYFRGVNALIMLYRDGVGFPGKKCISLFANIMFLWALCSKMGTFVKKSKILLEKKHAHYRLSCPRIGGLGHPRVYNRVYTSLRIRSEIEYGKSYKLGFQDRAAHSHIQKYYNWRRREQISTLTLQQYCGKNFTWVSAFSDSWSPSFLDGPLPQMNVHAVFFIPPSNIGV